MVAKTTKMEYAVNIILQSNNKTEELGMFGYGCKFRILKSQKFIYFLKVGLQ